MHIKKGVSENLPGFVKWFSELNKGSGSIAGGKGANLAEIYNLGVQVPPGFVITAQAYDYFIKTSGLNDKIKILLEKIDYENTELLEQITKEIRGLIESGKFPEEMGEEILEAYEVLGAEDSNLRDKPAHYIIKKTSEPVFVAVRSSATTEDLAEASFAGQQETFLNVRGGADLLKSVKKCFASLFTPRATYYRNKKGFRHGAGSLAVIIQRMVDSDKSGVIFSKDPSMKREEVIIEAVFGLGEGIVSGKITPDRYIVSRNLEILEKETGDKKIAITRNATGGQQIVKLKEERAREQVLKDHEVRKLAEIALRLEAHYQKPQDIEFAIESNEIYIVQTRPITTLEKRFSSENLKELKGEMVLSGLAASPGIGVGKTKIVHGMEDLKKVEQGDVLVTEMTNPDMVVTMQRCSAIVTDEGGITAHAAIVSREMGIPAVVGTRDATRKLKEGEIITVDGFTGKIYKGRVSEAVQKEIRPVVFRTKTNLKVILDLPSFAPRAAKTRLKGVGLARLEGIIAESGKHPNYFLKKGKIADYEEMIFRGLRKISDHFDDIWVRTSDIRSDEFQNLEGSPEKVEANPMLGMHGIRFSLENPEILRAELNAMKKVSENKEGKSIGILTPQVISIEEVKRLKEILKEVDFKNAKIGVMIETPASVQIIREICEEGIDFVSFGTNDLTQYTLAVDRGNEQVQPLYDDMHPSVLAQIAYVIKICRENNVETSICGQAGSKKTMVKFLVEKGIDSISVNADVAADIAEYIAELEKGTTETETIKPEETHHGDAELRKNRPGVVNLEEEGTGDSVEEGVSGGHVIQDYTGSDDELPVIPGTEYTKIEEQEEEIKKEDDSHPHFVKVMKHSEKEPWRTDIIFGQKGSNPHGHLALSGAAPWYFREEQGKEIIKNSKEVEKKVEGEQEKQEVETKEETLDIF